MVMPGGAAEWLATRICKECQVPMLSMIRSIRASETDRGDRLAEERPRAGSHLRSQRVTYPT
jgi:hypothetical protein